MQEEETRTKVKHQPGLMASNILRHLALFFLCIFLCSGSSSAEKPPLEEGNNQNKPLQNQEDELRFSSSLHVTQLDDIPIVNPTPETTSPPAPTLSEPSITPTNPATPTTTPATPTTTPVTPTTTPATGPGISDGGSWCIASSAASPTALQVALDYACGYGGADCSAIQPSASCYEPNTLKDHASYAFNDYYQKNPVPTSCDFGGTAQLTNTDPSSGNCHYATSRATPSISPPANPTPTPTTIPTPTPPAITTPTTETPTDSSIYGAEPTGMPSSATSISKQSLLLLAMTCVLGSLVGNHL